jgi:calcium-dependent protein kinase
MASCLCCHGGEDILSHQLTTKSNEEDKRPDMMTSPPTAKAGMEVEVKDIIISDKHTGTDARSRYPSDDTNLSMDADLLDVGLVRTCTASSMPLEYMGLAKKQSDSPKATSSGNSHAFGVASTNSIGPLRRKASVVSMHGDIRQWYITEEIPFASGSVGNLYRGTAVDSQASYAVKSIAYKQIPDTELFEQELEITKMLKHPNVIRMQDIVVNEAIETMYLVMDFCTGGDMFDVIHKNYVDGTALPEATLARFASEMLSGIKYCHHHNFCHRDIKPENYMLESKETLTLKLVDFGLACIFQPNVPMTLECGTPAHMAPEVYQRSYNEKIDVWSIGTTFHQLCVGRAPFYDRDPYRERDIILRGPDIEVFLRRSDFKGRWDLIQGDLPGIQSLIKDLVVVDPSVRPSAKAARAGNTWLSNGGFSRQISPPSEPINATENSQGDAKGDVPGRSTEEQQGEAPGQPKNCCSLL